MLLFKIMLCQTASILEQHSGKDEPTSAEGGQEREPREHLAGQQRRHNGDGQSRGEGFEPAEQQKHKRHCHERAQCQRKAPPMMEQHTSEGAQAGGGDDERRGRGIGRSSGCGDGCVSRWWTTA